MQNVLYRTLNPQMASSDPGLSGQHVLQTVTEHIQAFSGTVSRLHLLITGTDADNQPSDIPNLLEELRNQMIGTCRLTDIKWETSLQDVFQRMEQAMYAWAEESSEATRVEVHESSEELRALFLRAVNRYLHGEQDSDEDSLPGYDTMDDPSEAIVASVTAASRQDAQLCSNAQDVLRTRDDGVNATLLASKTLSKYLKEVIAYLEKRAAVQADYERKLKALADTTIQSVRETGAQPGHEEVLQMLAAHSERSQRVIAQCTGTNHKLTHTAPIADARQDHDRTRKTNKDLWMRDCRKLTEALDKSSKSKASYLKAANEWEKSLTQRQQAEESKYKLKLDKRNKEESDLRQKVDDLRSAHVSSLGAANAARVDLLRTREDTIVAVTESIFACGQSLKDALLTYHQDEYRVHLADSNDAQHLQERLDVYRSAPDVARCLEDISAQADAFVRPDVLQFEPHAMALERVNYLKDRGFNNACLDQSVDSGSPSDAKSPRGSVSVMSAQEVARQPDMHAFTRLTIPSKCRHCKKACYFHSVYCTKCHIACHRRCTEDLEVTCSLAQRARAVSMVKRMRQQSVFGSSLAESIADGEDGVPVLVRRLCEAVERHGIETEGIYRLSGVKSRVEDLCARFESNPRAVNVDDEDSITLAAVLKLYLRQLPEPVVPLMMQPAMMALAKERMDDNDNPECEANCATKIADLVQSLPTVNAQTLAYLCGHLHRIGLHNEVNKMKFSNLAIVFGPTLMRAPADGLQALMNMPMQSMAVEIMIKHCETVFPDFFEQRSTLKPSLHARSLALHGSDSSLFRRGSIRSTARFAQGLDDQANEASRIAEDDNATTFTPETASIDVDGEFAQSLLATNATPSGMPLSVSGHTSPSSVRRMPSAGPITVASAPIPSTANPGDPLPAPPVTQTPTAKIARPHRKAPTPVGQPIKRPKPRPSTRSKPDSPVKSTVTATPEHTSAPATPAPSARPFHSRLASLASNSSPNPDSPGTPSVAPRPPSSSGSSDNVLTPHLPPEIAALLNPLDIPPPPSPGLPGTTGWPSLEEDDEKDGDQDSAEIQNLPPPVFPDDLPPPPEDMLSSSTSPGSLPARSRSDAGLSDEEDLDWQPDQFV
eukprot:TRINITY_DN10430_c0_g1_i1.p1 TRINITY_DN10430_c0_g1~~TRINITY_DN10430_c0_g1_i1.p1  ORF type:complete len:1112 (+),score=245.70 TRINITY_DN10430_c0_g1_i1:96-3431(+)